MSYCDTNGLSPLYLSEGLVLTVLNHMVIVKKQGVTVKCAHKNVKET